MSKLKDHLVGTGILLGLALGQVNAANAQSVSFPDDVTIRRGNTNPNSTNISQYLVYVPDPASLPRVKMIAPDAFISILDSGQRVIQIGRFNNLDLAQRRVDELKRSGLETQVIAAKGQAPKVPIVEPSNIPYYPPSSIPITRSVALPDVPNPQIRTNNSATILNNPPAITPLPAPPSVNENPRTRESTKNRYFVIIPSTSDAVLGKAQALVPSARLTSSERGTYIEVQGYPDRPSADTLNATMRSQGLDARVIYF